MGGLYDKTNINDFWQIVDQIHNVFQLKIVNDSMLRGAWGPRPSETYPAYKNILTHSKLYTKIMYNSVLYFIDEVDKVGFSILNNAIMIAEYGLTDYISKLKMSSLKYEDLIDQNYTINAL
ncbi:MAG: hypothetical protein K2I16_03565 [Muribaculaceae bacterium]|nr:hypothetical protein [Muribaculaceae bacterium]